MKKKNWILRIATIAIVLTVATACLVSGTFAKYTTTVSGNDNATVAQWTIDVTTDTVDYATPAAQLIGIFDTINLDTNLAAGDIIAPEAEGDFDIVITMTGSEVSATLTSTVTETNADAINIKYFIGETKPADDSGYTIDSGDLKAALETAIDGDIEQAATMEKELKVWWKWVSSDAADTILGEAGTATITLEIEITATQKITV